MTNLFKKSKYQNIEKWVRNLSTKLYKEDVWRLTDMEAASIPTKSTQAWVMLDFTMFQSRTMVNELKYYFLYNMAEGKITPESVLGNYKHALQVLSSVCNSPNAITILDLDNLEVNIEKENERREFIHLHKKLRAFFENYYDDRDEYENGYGDGFLRNLKRGDILTYYAWVKENSTEENNPEKYLFNTFSGRCKGRPISKELFVKAVRNLIYKEKITIYANALFI